MEPCFHFISNFCQIVKEILTSPLGMIYIESESEPTLLEELLKTIQYVIDNHISLN